MAVDDKNTKAVIASNSKLDAVNEKLQKINDTMAGVKTSADASADATEDAKNQAAKDASEQKEEERASLRQRIKDSITQNKAAKAALAGTRAITNGFKSIGGIFSKGLAGLKGVGQKTVGSVFELIKKGALAAGLAAMLFIFDPKYWEPIKKFIMEKIVPGLLFLKDDILPKVVKLVNEDIIPLFKFIFNYLKDKFWQPLKDFFTNWFGDIGVLYGDIKDAFCKIAEGDIKGGLIGLFKGIGKFVLSTIDNIATLIYNVIANIFGFDTTDSVGGSIMGFFRGIGETVNNFICGIRDTIAGWYEGSKQFFSDAWNGFKQSVQDMVNAIKNWLPETVEKLKEFLGKSNVGTFIMDVVNDAVEAVKCIFAGEEVIANLKKLAGSMIDWVFWPVNAAVNFVKDMFSWGKEESEEAEAKEPFRLSEFIFGLVDRVVKGVSDLFANIFAIDFAQMAKDLKGKVFNIGRHIKATVAAAAKATAVAANPFTKGDNMEAASAAYKKTYNEIMLAGTTPPADASAVAGSNPELMAKMGIDPRTQAIKDGTVAKDAQGNYTVVSANTDNSSKSSSTVVQSAPVIYNDPLLNDILGTASP